MTAHTVSADAPIGVFDSGVGGLSVLRHIRAQLPHEDLIYFADSGFAPYGNKPEQVVAERSLAVAGFLVEHGAKALVVACNTASATSLPALRERFPQLPVIGVIDPGARAACDTSASGRIAVLATEGTVQGGAYERAIHAARRGGVPHRGVVEGGRRGARKDRRFVRRRQGG